MDTEITPEDDDAPILNPLQVIAFDVIAVGATISFLQMHGFGVVFSLFAGLLGGSALLIAILFAIVTIKYPEPKDEHEPVDH